MAEKSNNILWDDLNRVHVLIIQDEDGVQCFGVYSNEHEAYRSFIEDYVLRREDFSDYFCEDSMEDFREALDNNDWKLCKQIYDEGRNWSVSKTRINKITVDERA